MNKKAQIAELMPMIIGLVVVGMVLIVGFLIFAEMKDQVVDIGTTNTTLNETVVWTNGTLTALVNADISMEVTCIEVRNLSNDGAESFLIGTGNYTCGKAGLNLTNTTTGANALGGNNLSVGVWYNYKIETRAWNATGEVQNATQDIPGWLPIIVVTVIGALLIGLVSYFRRK